MLKYTQVADHSPVYFLQGVQDMIQDGYYADSSIVGFPHFGIINEIRLHRHPQPEQRNDLSGLHTAVIQGYEALTFILDVQDAIIQGFEIDPQTVEFGSPHTVVLTRPPEAILALSPVTPVAQDTPEAPIASHKPTERPKATQSRKPRTQSQKTK